MALLPLILASYCSSRSNLAEVEVKSRLNADVLRHGKPSNTGLVTNK